MKYHPEIHNRHSIRLKDYDYTQEGAYFVTVCSYGRECLFGEVINEEMQPNQFGQIVVDSWLWLAKHYPYVALDAWVVMPNHFHGIMVIGENDEGGSRTAPTKIKSLGRLIGAFKTVSTKQINLIRQTPSLTLWQRNYYERIIRNESELNRIREYIEANPAKWASDKENPANRLG